MSFREILEHTTKVIEGIGVVVLVAGVLWSTITAIARRSSHSASETFRHLRRTLGRTILLGLEILVVADIVHTVATTPTFESLGVLGLLILIRTFLSIEIEMELEGRWPWDRHEGEGRTASEG